MSNRAKIICISVMALMFAALGVLVVDGKMHSREMTASSGWDYLMRYETAELTPADVRVLADTIQQAIIIQTIMFQWRMDQTLDKLLDANPIKKAQYELNIAGLLMLSSGSDDVVIGRCSCVNLLGSGNLLLGDYTGTPSGASGFVNIANKLCFWRMTGERVACPPPEPECEGKP